MQRIYAVTSVRVISVQPQQTRLGNIPGGLDLVEVSYKESLTLNP